MHIFFIKSFSVVLEIFKKIFEAHLITVCYFFPFLHYDIICLSGTILELVYRGWEYNPMSVWQNEFSGVKWEKGRGWGQFCQGNKLCELLIITSACFWLVLEVRNTRKVRNSLPSIPWIFLKKKRKITIKLTNQNRHKKSKIIYYFPFMTFHSN